MPLLHEPHPSYDPLDGHSVRAYFEDLELLFRRHDLANEAEKKYFACKYGCQRTLWESLAEYSKDTANYEDLKRVVLDIYPLPFYSNGALKAVIARWRQRPISNHKQYMEYYREFLLIVNMGIKKKHFTTHDAAWKLLEALPEAHRLQVQDFATTTFRGDFLESDLALSDMHAAASKFYSPSWLRTVVTEDERIGDLSGLISKTDVDTIVQNVVSQILENPSFVSGNAQLVLPPPSTPRVPVLCDYCESPDHGSYMRGPGKISDHRRPPSTTVVRRRPPAPNTRTRCSSIAPARLMHK
ncbi:hypothetical protein EIP91_004546 [Steccherinum ochraceum]|uniref:Uncharacterized protein n=1 Tax=Steccherinum ochraceum TaxID=92696 RepID=A0A4R0RP15_9APHY|nr:hypothetical protein EIP91_004546 [Steccherinum ochraceum]